MLRRDGYLCRLCYDPSARATSVDHIIPRSKGGTDAYNNLQAAHLKCNISKKDRLRPVAPRPSRFD